MKIEKGKLYYDNMHNKVVKSVYDAEIHGELFSNKIAVHCPTKADWEYVRSKGCDLCGYRQNSNSGIYYNLYQPYWADKKYYDSIGYHTITIDQFKEFYTEVDKFAELKEAHKNGAVIQWRREIDGRCVWKDCHDNDPPTWNDINEYRIKPEEKPEVPVKYYFVTYQGKLKSSDTISIWNQIIAGSPLKFIKDREDYFSHLVILNTLEITKEEFEEFKNKF